MSRPRETVYIHDVAAGKPVEASLFEGLSPQNIADFTNQWKPWFTTALDEARRLKKQGQPFTYPEDYHWDWGDKFQTFANSLSYKQFAIEYDGMTQGLMQIQTAMARSRLAYGKDVVYVDFLSTAPWNRKTLKQPEDYRLVGSCLMIRAVEESVDIGFEGRLGLHSLPGAEDYYEQKLNMKNCGPDPAKQNLVYYEWSEEDAKKFINNEG